jgi:sugar O-acyltransferase (sialic acid O-acetyltransferase NeuD family)
VKLEMTPLNLKKSKENFESDNLSLFHRNFKILNSINQVKNNIGENFNFVLGIGGPKLRKKLFNFFISNSGNAVGLISKNSFIGSHCVNVEDGVDIMSQVSISSNVSIGKGTLINRFVSIHHDCIIGEFCEIAPGAMILGNVKIDNLSFIGSGAIILPNVRIGKNCIVAAGAVVTKDVPNNSTVIGVPAELKKSK